MRKFALSVTVAASALGFALSSAAADITIATAGPMTGDYAAFGQQMERGAKAAVADINAAGGVNGEKLVLEVGDDVCDPKQAVAVANDFVQKGVIFVAGHFCSGSSLPASDVYIEENILQMTPASTNPAFTDGPAADGITTIFRTCGRDDQQGDFAGKWIAENMGDKNIAVLHDKSTYGKGIADRTKAMLNAEGVTEKMYEAYTAGEQDYTALVSKLKAENIDVIYLGGYHTEGALIIRQAREQGLDAQLLGPPRKWSQRSVPRASSRKATPSILMPRSKSGRTPPIRPAPPTRKRSPRPCVARIGRRLPARSASTSRAT